MKAGRRTAKRYDGKIAVVTGASSGIGRQIAVDLAHRGATIIGLARRQQLLTALEAEIRVVSPNSCTLVCDISDEIAVPAALHSIEEERGRIDVLVNSAGIDRIFSALAGDLGTVREICEVNFFGAANATLAVLPGMVARGNGIVVNVSSDSARAPEPRQAPYSASKAALSSFTEALAYEVAGLGVQMHILYPGWVPTAMNASLRAEGTPLPPKAVRRTTRDVSSLLLDRMGDKTIEINAALLPLLAPICRSFAPRFYQRWMRRLADAHEEPARASTGSRG
jgi:short-subunit dehydrogenase